MTDYPSFIQAEVQKRVERLRADLVRRPPWSSTIDEEQFTANVRTGPQTTHSTRKLAVGNGRALTAEPSDSTNSIPFRQLPKESRDIILGLRQSLREALDVTEPTHEDLHHSVDVLSRLVLALCHLALDDPRHTAEEKAHKLETDPEFREAEEHLHIYEVDGEYEPRRKERFNEEVHADLLREPRREPEKGEQGWPA
jgi:hypothetical protein